MSSAPPGDRGDDPGLEVDPAGRADAAVLRSRSARSPSAVSAAARPASRRWSIGVVPAWEAWPRKSKP